MNTPPLPPRRALLRSVCAGFDTEDLRLLVHNEELTTQMRAAVRHEYKRRRRAYYSELRALFMPIGGYAPVSELPF